MIHDGRVKGLPLVDYLDTKANIEALSNLEEGMTAYASDTDELGAYDGSAWHWSRLDIDHMTGSTYVSVQDWFDVTQSSGIISGGAVTSDGDGSITVAAGQGMIRSAASDIGDIKFFDWSEDTSLTPDDGVASFISMDYNGGGAGVPAPRTDTSNPSNGQTVFNLAHVFREGNDVYVADMAATIPSSLKRVYQQHLEDSMVDVVSGGIVSESGARYLAVTEIVAWHGLNRETFAAIDTDNGDDLELYYNDGAWQENTVSQLGNSQYNNYGVGLANLTSNKYGVYWVYIDFVGNLLVVYGTLNGTLAAATEMAPPTQLPPHAADFSILAAKIIFQEGGANFTQVLSTSGVIFTASGAVEHNETAGLQGGTAEKYYHVMDPQTGWTAATGTADRTTFATNTVTLEELAQRVKALIDDGITHELIGA